MVEEIEVKRKVYTVVEQIGEHSFKVERKGQFFFFRRYRLIPPERSAFQEAKKFDSLH